MENNHSHTRRKALGLVGAGLAAPYLTSSALAATTPILVELFTSQGCSSCPPADHLAGRLMSEPNVTVVSLNVDYWDYLGWKDTLAKPEYTKRQMDYAHARGDNDVYTPQMVINGSAHAVGSNQGTVEKAIANARRGSGTRLLQMNATNSEINIEMPKESNTTATLWVMSVASSISVKIERGENSGKSITYHNVVRKLTNVATWNGTASNLTVPRKGVIGGDCKSCVAVLQEGTTGPLLGLGKFSEIGA
jgi:hypothetical protein